MLSATGCGGPRRARWPMPATRCRPAPSQARAPTIPPERRTAGRRSLHPGVVDPRAVGQREQPGEIAHALEAFDRRQAAVELGCPLGPGERLHVLLELGGEILVGEGMLRMAREWPGVAADHRAVGHLDLDAAEIAGLRPLVLAARDGAELGRRSGH